VLLTCIVPKRCDALPSFARQMNMQCIACHTEFPILTDMGRQFKLTAYTLSAEQTKLPPIAFMLQPSFTNTGKGQVGGAGPGFKDNNNFALNQASVFYSGRLFGPYASELFGSDAASFLNKFGIFSQTTYDGFEKKWAWDNVDVRFADSATLNQHALIYGVYANNNPTLQDPWNSTPAFSFPFSGSGLAPAPAASAMIDGAFSGQVAGVGIYTMLDSEFYFDVGAYRTLSVRTQRELGADPNGEAQIAGVAPYWRFAYTKPVPNGSWEMGVFGLAPSTFPGRDKSVGRDRTTDFGFDSDYQSSVGRGNITLLFTGIYETTRWNASNSLGNADNRRDHLLELKATVDYLFDKTWGFAIQRFSTTGSRDAAVYSSSDTGSPNSNGFIFQANFMPFNKRGGPDFWPRSNVKLSVQYTYYGRFDGLSNHADADGHRATDNNTLYIESWIMF